MNAIQGYPHRMKHYESLNMRIEDSDWNNQDKIRADGRQNVKKDCQIKLKFTEILNTFNITSRIKELLRIEKMFFVYF